MTKKNSNKGITLLELIIASVLVGVVILGLFSVDSVLKNNNQDYGQKFLLNSQTQATMNLISNNAALAVGSGTSITLSDGNTTANDTPILTNVSNDQNTFCFHQAGGNNQFNDQSANGIWLCYTFYKSANSNVPANYNQIWYCGMPYTINVAIPNLGAAPCNTAAITPGEGPVYLGTAFSITGPNPLTSPNPNPPNFSNGTFNMTIENCLNDSAPSCSFDSQGDATPIDPVNNPEIVKTISVYPIQAGSGN